MVESCRRYGDDTGRGASNEPETRVVRLMGGRCTWKEDSRVFDTESEAVVTGGTNHPKEHGHDNLLGMFDYGVGHQLGH
ncbi:hypothetical protein EYF80_018762 [Liparis tanakae]|uniref:Uncharacterized protein n=1 Tax=Liparis tanakae TaxID=230148 RepID=A0A4Z2HYN1_9TELE|nr:hypothetical protein EYF80_018762 [Liparis tanakae]